MKDSRGSDLKVGDEVLIRAKVTNVVDADTGANGEFTAVGGNGKEPAPSFSCNTSFVTKAPPSAKPNEPKQA